MAQREDRQVFKKDSEEIKRRRAALVEIVETEDVEKQERFVPLLRSKGFEVSPSTVSRDLKVLAIDMDPKTGCYAVSDLTMILQWKDRLQGFLRNDLVELADDVRLLAVKTTPGMARSTAVALERSYPKEVLGSISGDDLAIIVTRDEMGHTEVMEQLAVIQKRKKAGQKQT
ncbi:MAG: hypothetical protein RO469_15925 [Thermincola sp.]|jgi:transcriptional regulator of arginine metabolism|nr:hypothetical protein [Thermincola sp.]MDT3704519.1 hypothetical protein [Thermincola sp.]